MTQRLTHDVPSFEQVLSALSLVQQLKEQVPQGFVSDPEDGPLSELVETQQAIETETVDLEAALARVVSLARQLTPATGAAVWFLTEHDFVCRAATDGFAGDEGLRLEVLARLVVSDVANREGWESSAPARSLLVAPIHQGRNIVGALALFSLRPNAFSEGDGTRARLLSGLLAHALRKTADAELRQVVSLERAAMLEAMGQIMPALRRLAEDGGGESRCEAGTVTAAVADLEPATELTPEPLPDVLAGILTEVATGEGGNPVDPALQAAVAQMEARGNAGEQPHAFRLLQEETQSEAKAPAVAKANGSSEAEACAIAVVEPAEQPSAQVGTEKMEARAPDEAATKASSGTTRATSGRAGTRRAAWVEARMWWAAHRLEDVGSAVMIASRNTGMHLRLVATRGLKAAMWMPRQLRGGGVLLSAVSSARLRGKRTPEVAAAVKSPLRGSAAAPGKLRAEGKASWKRRRNAMRRAAGPVLVLLIVAAHLIMMRITGVPSHAEPPRAFGSGAVSAGPRAPIGGAATTPATVLAKLSSMPSLTAPVFPMAAGRGSVNTLERQGGDQESGELSGSHLTVTDTKAGAELASLSQFEVAGLRRKAQNGDDGAAFLLGMAYETGRGVEQSCVKAREWVTLSAEAGNAAAQYNLGMRYREGDGVAADPELAEKWLKRAAERKYARALPR